MYIFKPNISERYSKCCWYEGVVSSQMCDDIIAMFNHENSVKAGIHQSNKQDELLRKSEVTWLHYNENIRWIFDVLEKHVREVNSTKYNFQLSGFYEALQLTKYPPGGHYTWHEDSDQPTFTTRKLSVVLQLSDPSTYSGGELIVFPNTKPPRTRGSIYLFPSFVTHKVNAVEQGTRYSLVAWATGHPFR